MKLLKVLVLLVTLSGLAAVALLGASSVHGQAPDSPVIVQGVQGVQRVQGAQGAQWRPGRELRILAGRGSEIGVRVTDALESPARGAGGGGGVRIEEVQPGSPAEKAGLKRGDVIVEFDGEHVRGTRQFARLVQETPPGRTASATVLREGQTTQVQITTGEGREMSSLMIDGDRLREYFGDLGNPRDYLRPFNFNFDLAVPGVMSGARLGVNVVELTNQLAQYFGAKEGVLVSSVADGSAAARAGVRAGDVITSINGQRVATREDLLRGLRDTRQGDGPAGSGGDIDVKLSVVRDKKDMSITVKLDAPGRTPDGGRDGRRGRGGRPA
jgi:serine protease Do